MMDGTNRIYLNTPIMEFFNKLGISLYKKLFCLVLVVFDRPFAKITTQLEFLFGGFTDEMFLYPCYFLGCLSHFFSRKYFSPEIIVVVASINNNLAQMVAKRFRAFYPTDKCLFG